MAIRYRHVLIGVEGEDRARRAVIAAIGAGGEIVPGSEQAFDVDAVCVGYGFLPQAEAARALGCAFRAGPNGAVEAERDEDGRTDVPRVFIVGDGGGLGGARVAIAQGVAAAAAVADDLGHGVDPAERARARRQLHRHRAFQHALWSLYEPVGPFVSDDADVLVCRCENVTARAIAALAAGDHTDMGALKRASRAGMGACQGRYCASLLARRLPRAAEGEPLAFAPRPPFKPVPVAMIAGLDNSPA